MSDGPVSDRAHLSIGEVLSLLQEEFSDITISKIRFLESQGLIEPERTPSGYRKFYEADVERLRWVLRQQRENFLPLRVIKDRLEEGADVEGQTVLALEAVRHVEPADGSEPPHDDEHSASPPILAVVTTDDDGDPATPPVSDEPIVAPAVRSLLTTGPLGEAASSVSLTFDELVRASGLAPEPLADLERFGLITGRAVGPAVLYDDEALLVARLAAVFGRHGIEARHLRSYKVSAEREAGLFEQVVSPLLKQRNPGSRHNAVHTLNDLAGLGEQFRQAMLRQILRQYLGHG